MHILEAHDDDDYKQQKCKLFTSCAIIKFPPEVNVGDTRGQVREDCRRIFPATSVCLN